jgi:hypothetical protein
MEGDGASPPTRPLECGTYPNGTLADPGAGVQGQGRKPRALRHRLHRVHHTHVHQAGDGAEAGMDGGLLETGVWGKCIQGSQTVG